MERALAENHLGVREGNRWCAHKQRPQRGGGGGHSAVSNEIEKISFLPFLIFFSFRISNFFFGEAKAEGRLPSFSPPRESNGNGR